MKHKSLLKDALSFTDYSKEQKRELVTAIQDLSWGFEYGQRFNLKKEISFTLGRESTYGDRVHKGRDHRLDYLGKTLVKALSDKGKVFIPAFSPGRTQELLYDLDRLFRDEKWSEQFPELQQQGRGKAPVPVFVDSPLALQGKIFSSMPIAAAMFALSARK